MHVKILAILLRCLGRYMYLVGTVLPASYRPWGTYLVKVELLEVAYSYLCM